MLMMRKLIFILLLVPLLYQAQEKTNIICGKWELLQRKRGACGDSVLLADFKKINSSELEKKQFLVLNENGNEKNDDIFYEKLNKGTWKVISTEQNMKSLEIFGKGKSASVNKQTLRILYLSEEKMILNYQSKDCVYLVFRKVKS